MTCFLVDDELTLNAKVDQAIAAFGGLAVVGFWTGCGTRCGRKNSGVVEASTASAVGRWGWMTPEEIERAAKALVTARLWHDVRTVRRCAVCSEHLATFDLTLPKGAYLFHDWGRQQFNRQEAKDPVRRSGRTRKQALHRMPELVKAIRARDGEFCRYCGDWVNFDARTGDKAGTYDHLIPDDFDDFVDDHGEVFPGGNALHKIVVACNLHNRQKGQRTPEEWLRGGGLPLLAEPDRRSEIPNPRVRTAQTAEQDGSGLTDARTRVGTGQGRAGAGPETGSGREGSGLVPVPQRGEVA